MLAQSTRRQRAEAEYDRYQFRAMKIAGQPAVCVISPTGSIYTTNT